MQDICAIDEPMPRSSSSSRNCYLSANFGPRSSPTKHQGLYRAIPAEARSCHCQQPGSDFMSLYILVATSQDLRLGRIPLPPAGLSNDPHTASEIRSLVLVHPLRKAIQPYSLAWWHATEDPCQRSACTADPICPETLEEPSCARPGWPWCHGKQPLSVSESIWSSTFPPTPQGQALKCAVSSPRGRRARRRAPRWRRPAPRPR